MKKLILLSFVQFVIDILFMAPIQMSNSKTKEILKWEFD